ncbi:FmdE family protein [Stetteria hydrogenophila]
MGASAAGGLRELLVKAGEFHGHICPYLALGVKMSVIAMEKLGVGRTDGLHEDLLAIVEANNCMVDGVQVVTGCTFGNNSLIYLDLGKNALTLVRRSDWRGVRVYFDAEEVRRKYFDPEAVELFRKVVARREGTREEAARLRRLFEEISWRILEEMGEDEFKVEHVRVDPIERAPVFESVRCRRCGELAMATRVKGGLCLRCLGTYYGVVGRGIVKIVNGRIVEVV